MTPSARHKRPGFWSVLPATFPDDPKPSVMLAEFGAPGPYALIVLITTATAQSYTGGRWGWLRIGWPAFASKLGVTVDQARVLVERLGELGEMDSLEVTEFGFSGHLNGWEKWHGPPAKDRTATERKRRERDRDRA